MPTFVEFHETLTNALSIIGEEKTLEAIKSAVISNKEHSGQSKSAVTSKDILIKITSVIDKEVTIIMSLTNREKNKLCRYFEVALLANHFHINVKEVCGVLQISEKTYYQYCRMYPEVKINDKANPISVAYNNILKTLNIK